jgi:hypothetical protein
MNSRLKLYATEANCITQLIDISVMIRIFAVVFTPQPNRTTIGKTKNGSSGT